MNDDREHFARELTRHRPLNEHRARLKLPDGAEVVGVLLWLDPWEAWGEDSYTTGETLKFTISYLDCGYASFLLYPHKKEFEGEEAVQMNDRVQDILLDAIAKEER